MQAWRRRVLILLNTALAIVSVVMAIAVPKVFG
jgi:hypothetical protein